MRLETHQFLVNVDYLKVAVLDALDEVGCKYLVHSRLRPVSNSHHFMINHQGTKDLGNFDITDPYQFSEAECISRRQVLQMTQAMREYGTGDVKNGELTGTSPQIGVRESRRIQGSYILTEEDAMEGRKFEDVIAWRSGWLGAGRCISATHEGASAGKSMGNCFATGHAAGVAASLASQQNKVPRELDVKEIQQVLSSHDVDLTKGGEEQSKKMAN